MSTATHFPGVDHGACERCGTYAPRAPFWGRSLCDACIDRVSAQDKSELRASTLLGATWRMALPVLLPALVMHHLVGLPNVIRASLGLPNWSWLPALNALVDVVTVHICLQAQCGRHYSLRYAVAELARRSGVLLRTGSLVALYTLPWLLLLIAPGVMRWLLYCIAMPIALLERERVGLRGKVALRTSRERMLGHRTAAFWVYALVFSAIAVPAFVGGVMSELNGAFRNLPQDRTIEVATQLLASTLGVLMPVVCAALYKATLPADAAKQVSAQLAARS